ncbi:MAG: hypothetical protein AMXMBFR57_31670 [Acidimicrobiia bacterium]|jgi:hypothetical protein
MKRVLVSVVLCLALLAIAAGRLGVVKADVLLAAACTPELLRPHDDLEAVLRRHRSAFIAQGKASDLPPEFLAAIVADHHAALTPVRRFTDCAGSALGADVSLGPAQVRISTAVGLDAAGNSVITPHTFHLYRSRLLNPAENIRYQARELRASLDRQRRGTPMDANGLVHDPATMARLVTEYRVGHLPESFDPDVRRTSAESTLRFMYAGEFFNRSAEGVMRIRQGLERYLTYLNCETRNSTPSTCQEWKAWMQYPVPRRLDQQ